MIQESIYGDKLPEMQKVLENLQDHIGVLRNKLLETTGMDPIEHCLGRIKSEESMREKCRRNSLPETQESALVYIQDAIGLRIVCAFLDDVYRIRDHIAKLPGVTIVQEKDYIKEAKPNGYRSYHMILQTDEGFYSEIQIRTISMDTCAALEHHLKYKKDISGNMELITSELKRCAEELAATDASMQTLKEMILTL